MPKTNIKHMERSEALASLLTIAGAVERVYELVPDHSQHDLEPLQNDIAAAFDSIHKNAVVTIGTTQTETPVESLTATLCLLEEMTEADLVYLEAERYEGCLVARCFRDGVIARVAIDPDRLEDEQRPLAAALATTVLESWAAQTDIAKSKGPAGARPRATKKA
jgi:hypothetical protein